MGVFDHDAYQDHQQVVFCHREAVGLTAIIAIHDTTLGPAIGGCRMAPYPTEDDALTEALRMSRAMTYKAACAGIDLGGSAAVIIGDPAQDKTEVLMRAFGQFVDSLDGRFIASTDIGTTSEDMDCINLETDHVCGVGQHYGGSGDPSPVCAWGVLYGMKAVSSRLWEGESLAGKKIAIQGSGKVGYQLARYLYDEGAELYVSDIDGSATDRVKREFGATIVDADEIYEQDADIFAPCALGGALRTDTIERLKAKAVVGSANNQLQDEARDAEALRNRDVLYAPDFVVNAGGLISVYTEIHAAPREKAMRDTEGIATTLGRIFDLAERDGISTLDAANRVAEQRIRDLGALASFHVGPLQ